MFTLDVSVLEQGIALLTITVSFLKYFIFVCAPVCTPQRPEESVCLVRVTGSCEPSDVGAET